MSLKKEERDLEFERDQFLNQLNEQVSVELQKKIKDAISFINQSNEIVVHISDSGAANANAS